MVIPSDIEQLINSFNAAAWIFYGLCFASLLIMRITHRRDKRPYKVYTWLCELSKDLIYFCSIIVTHMFCTCN